MLIDAGLLRAVLRERIPDAQRVGGERFGQEEGEDQGARRASGPPARSDRHRALDHVSIAGALDTPARVGLDRRRTRGPTSDRKRVRPARPARDRTGWTRGSLRGAI